MIVYDAVTCDMSNAFVDPWDMLNNFCFHVSLKVIVCHAVTCHMSTAYVDPWAMLNNFCLHVNYSQMPF